MANLPSTVTMNVSLPQPLKEYVDGKVSSGIYGSASEFVRETIRERYEQDQERQEAKKALADKLLKGLSSGKPTPFNEGHFQRKKAALAKRAGRGAKQS